MNLPTQSDLILYVIGLVIIGSMTLVTQVISKRSNNYFAWRKLLHFTALMTCQSIIARVDDLHSLSVLFILLGVILVIIAKNKWLNISKGGSYGIGLFPLALALLYFIGVQRQYIVCSAVILAIADPLAGIIGSRFAKKKWQPLSEKKSMLGSITFFIASLPIIIFFNNYFLSSEFLPLLFLITFLITLSEMFSWRGSDNFWVILSSGLLLSMANNNGLQVWTALVVIVMVALCIYPLLRMRVLNLGGGIAALFMAGLIAATCSLSYLVFPFVFLVLGAMMSKVSSAKDSSDKQGRDAHQVFANGLPAMICAAMFGYSENEYWLILFALSFSVALADTLSSEGGRIFGMKTVDILSFKEIEKGLSGGVSAAGTIMGFIGAMVMAIIGTMLFHWPLKVSLFVLLLGFVGMIIDSILGSKIQRKYLVEGNWLEDYSSDNPTTGYHFIDNNLVNLLSISITIIIGRLLLMV